MRSGDSQEAVLRQAPFDRLRMNGLVSFKRQSFDRLRMNGLVGLRMNGLVSFDRLPSTSSG